MASLLTRVLASFQANIPNPTLDNLDSEFNQYVGASGVFNGGTTGKKLLIKTSDATDPPVDCDQVGAGQLARWKSNGVSKLAISNNGQISSSVPTGTSPLSVASVTVNTNFNADMVDGQHYTDIQTFVNTKVLRWCANFSIDDPSTFPLNSFSRCKKVLIPSGNFTATAIGMIFATGSASGSFSVQVRKHPFLDQSTQTTLGTITVNPGTLGQGAVASISHAFTDADFLYLILTAASSPLQRDVSIFVAGSQTPIV
jgi:hypothetical protein